MVTCCSALLLFAPHPWHTWEWGLWAICWNSSWGWGEVSTYISSARSVPHLIWAPTCVAQVWSTRRVRPCAAMCMQPGWYLERSPQLSSGKGLSSLLQHFFLSLDKSGWGVSGAQWRVLPCHGSMLCLLQGAGAPTSFRSALGWSLEQSMRVCCSGKGPFLGHVFSAACYHEAQRPFLFTTSPRKAAGRLLVCSKAFSSLHLRLSMLLRHFWSHFPAWPVCPANSGGDCWVQLRGPEHQWGKIETASMCLQQQPGADIVVIQGLGTKKHPSGC